MRTLKVSTTWLKRTRTLSDAEKGRLFTAMLQYANDGTAPAISGRESLLWDEAEEEIDKHRGISEMRSEAGRKGCNKRWQTITNDNKPSQTITNDNKEKTTPSDSPLKEKGKKGISKDIPKERELSPALQDAVQEFKDMRTRMHKPMTAKAVDRLMDRLSKLSSDEQTQVAILHQSVDRGWTDVYEIKDKPTQRNARNTLDNYKVVGTSHAALGDIAMDLEEL